MVHQNGGGTVPKMEIAICGGFNAEGSTRERGQSGMNEVTDAGRLQKGGLCTRVLAK